MLRRSTLNDFTAFSLIKWDILLFARNRNGEYSAFARSFGLPRGQSEDSGLSIAAVLGCR